MAIVIVVAVAGLAAIWIWKQSGRTALDFFGFTAGRVYGKLWHRPQSNGGAALPASGPALLVLNHTCSCDPALVQAAYGRPIAWLTSREHYESHPVVRAILDFLSCVPVRRTGKDGWAARTGLRRLKEGKVLGIFPEGNLSGIGLGRMRSLKAGAAWMALRSGVPVIPIWISGGPATQHILTAWLRPSRRGGRVTVGKPVDLSGYRGQRMSRRLVETVNEQLRKELLALSPKGMKDLAPPRRFDVAAD